jgi:hypothetical protein
MYTYLLQIGSPLWEENGGEKRTDLKPEVYGQKCQGNKDADKGQYASSSANPFFSLNQEQSGNGYQDQSKGKQV